MGGHLEDALVAQHVVLQGSKEFFVHDWSHDTLRPDEETIQNLRDKVIHKRSNAAADERAAHRCAQVHTVVDLGWLEECDDQAPKAWDLVHNGPQMNANCPNEADVRDLWADLRCLTPAMQTLIMAYPRHLEHGRQPRASG